ncbi:MAG: DNA recombination protein RmuC, partial [Pontixanthobacter sp.]
MNNIVFVIVTGVLLLGLAVGWFFGSRPVADWKARHAERDGEARDLDAKYLRAFADLEAAREKA